MENKEETRALGSLVADLAENKTFTDKKGWYYDLQDQAILELRRRGYRRKDISKMLGFASDVALGVYMHDRGIKLADAEK